MYPLRSHHESLKVESLKDYYREIVCRFQHRQARANLHLLLNFSGLLQRSHRFQSLIFLRHRRAIYHLFQLLETHQFLLWKHHESGGYFFFLARFFRVLHTFFAPSEWFFRS